MKKENEKKMSWYDVTLYQFLKLQELGQIEDETERIIAMSEIILGSDITELTIPEFKAKTHELAFLKEKMPEVNVPKKIEINGRKYFIDSLLGNLSTAQYIDYTNHAKEASLGKMLSAFVIPDGHKYNDGYDMVQVFNDIDCIPIPVVMALSFFFERQFNVYMKTFLRCSVKKIKKTNLPKETKKELVKLVENSAGMVLSHLYSNSAK